MATKRHMRTQNQNHFGTFMLFCGDAPVGVSDFDEVLCTDRRARRKAEDGYNSAHPPKERKFVRATARDWMRLTRILDCR
jgi:hypothetical protein